MNPLQCVGGKWVAGRLRFELEIVGIAGSDGVRLRGVGGFEMGLATEDWTGIKR